MDPQDVVDEQATPLMMACKMGHERLVQILMTKKAKVNAVTSAGTTPLYLATQHNKLSIMRLLLDNNANPSLSLYSNGAFPLLMAVMQNNKQAVKLLLDHGAIVNQRTTDDQKTALHMAAFLGEEDIVRLLIQYHADLEAQTLDGFTPQSIAITKNHTRIAAYLQEVLANGQHIALPVKIDETPDKKEAFLLLSRQIIDAPREHKAQLYYERGNLLVKVSTVLEYQAAEKDYNMAIGIDASLDKCYKARGDLYYNIVINTADSLSNSQIRIFCEKASTDYTTAIQLNSNYNTELSTKQRELTSLLKREASAEFDTTDDEAFREDQSQPSESPTPDDTSTYAGSFVSLDRG
jgi:hypothetical protein